MADKQKALSKLNAEEINIACIGDGHMPDVETVKKIFANYPYVVFHVFNRWIPVDKKDDLDFNYYPKCDTRRMMNVLKKCQYIFTMCEGKYIDNNTSGIIAMSFCTGCQLILPSSWKYEYLLESPIYYDLKSNEALTLPNVTQIKKVYSERDILMEKRNKIFSEMLTKSK
jgi:hypothetical protein